MALLTELQNVEVRIGSKLFGECPLIVCLNQPGTSGFDSSPQVTSHIHVRGLFHRDAGGSSLLCPSLFLLKGDDSVELHIVPTKVRTY